MCVGITAFVVRWRHIRPLGKVNHHELRLDVILISLTLITIAVRGIVCLNMNNAQRGGTRARSSCENCRNVLGLLVAIEVLRLLLLFIMSLY